MNIFAKVTLSTLLIITNLCSMEKDLKKRKLDSNQIEYSEKRYKSDSSGLQSEHLENKKILAKIAKLLQKLPMQSDDLNDRLLARLDIIKAIQLISNLPAELIDCVFSFMLEEQIEYLINQTLSNKKNKHYLDHTHEGDKFKGIKLLLEVLEKQINHYLTKFLRKLHKLELSIKKLELTSENMDITCFLSMKEFPNLNGLKIMRQMLYSENIKKIVSNKFKKILLEKFDALKNINIQDLCTSIIFKPESRECSKWKFLALPLLNNPSQIPDHLKTSCAHYAAKIDYLPFFEKLTISELQKTDSFIQSRDSLMYLLPFLGNIATSCQYQQASVLITALHFNSFNVAKWLIKNNIQLNHQDCNGDTALLSCIKLANIQSFTEKIFNFLEMIELLLEGGALVCIQNQASDNALSLWENLSNYLIALCNIDSEQSDFTENLLYKKIQDIKAVLTKKMEQEFEQYGFITQS